MNKLDLIKLSIKSIFVEWSESNLINDETTYTIAEFMAACENAATEAPQGGGYDKTKFKVIWNDDSEAVHRVDITADEHNPLDVLAYYID